MKDIVQVGRQYIDRQTLIHNIGRQHNTGNYVGRQTSLREPCVIGTVAIYDTGRLTSASMQT
jgi:hypothetical protein